DEALAQGAVPCGEAIAVALEKARQKLGDERLVDGRRSVQPAAGAQRMVFEQGAVQLRQPLHRKSRLRDAAAGDLIALAGRGDVLEQQREEAVALVVEGQRAARERPADARSELAIE